MSAKRLARLLVLPFKLAGHHFVVDPLDLSPGERRAEMSRVGRATTPRGGRRS